MSSKALKVLLALILAIGLMPAINTQQAFAVPASAVSVTEADGTTVKECDTSANASGNGWEWSKTGTLTITGTIAKVSVGASFGSDVTIKASVAASNAAIVTDSGAAIESAMAANEVTIDATESNLLVKTSAANKSAITVAQNLVVLGAENAKTLTVDEAISDDATAAVAVAGTVELAAMSSMVAESVEGAGITVDGSLTGAVISTDTTVINGSVSGNVTSADAVTVATAGNAVIDGDIILTADDIAVTVGNGLAGTGSYYSASIAGDITTDDATAKSLGTVSIGNAAAVQNPQAVTVDGSIAPTKDTVTVFGTATIKGAISVDASKTLTVERGAVVSGAITLGIGAELVNNSDSDIPVSCTDGRTDVAKANTTFTFATFSADMDKKSFDYTAKNLNAADAIKDHVSVYEANGQKVTSPFASDYTFKIFQADDYALNGAAATDLAASLVESGNYVAAVTKVTPGTEIHTVAFTVNKGTLANVYTVINDQQYTGDELNPVVTAMYVSERNVDGTIKTEAAIDNTGEKNFTVAYSDNTAVGTAKVALAFGANSSIKAGTVNGTFSITQADPAKNLAGATVKLIKGMDAAHPVVYAGTDITAANLTAATTGTGIVESIKIGSNTIAQANFGTTLAFSLASDPQGKTAIDKIDAAGTYYLVISNGTTGSYVNKKVVSIVVADGATLSKMTP
ncbi:MAG: polymer-forming cytoskeletal protein [Raoultibacter sp.]